MSESGISERERNVIDCSYKFKTGSVFSGEHIFPRIEDRINDERANNPEGEPNPDFGEWVEKETHYALEDELGDIWDGERLAGVDESKYKSMRHAVLVAVADRAFEYFGKLDRDLISTIISGEGFRCSLKNYMPKE